MSRKNIQFHPSAREELRAAFFWYRDKNPKAALDFQKEIKNGIEKLREAPEHYAIYSGVIRRYLLHCFPYSILFRQSQDAIQIIAVAHTRRKPGYWKKRLFI